MTFPVTHTAGVLQGVLDQPDHQVFVADLKPEEVPSIVAGARRGLGVMDLARIRLV